MESTVSLKELCTIPITDGTHQTPIYADEGYIFLSSKNVTSGEIDWENIVFIPEELHVDLCKRIAPQKDDILLAKNGTTGVAAIVDRDVVFDIYVSLALIRPDKSKVIPEYLLHAINSETTKRYFDSHLKGIGVPNLHLTHIRETPIRVPSFSRQLYIVNVMEDINQQIFLRKQQLAKLDELVKSRFVEMFGAYSAKNCKRRIGDYADVLGGYAFKSDLFCTDAIPVIRISNINDGRVTLDYSTCFSKDFWEQNKRFRAERMDIMMAMSGATTGKAGLYASSQPALINQRVACIRAFPNKACPEFLFVATQLEWMYDLIQETSAGCAQPNISGRQIENMPVPDASYEEQRQFASFVEQTDKSKFAVQKSIEKLETLKKSLMQQYFG